MKKLNKLCLLGILCFLLVLTPILGTSNIANADSNDIHLLLHYFRYDGDYSDWDVWLWTKSPSGTNAEEYHDNAFNSQNGEFRTLDMNLSNQSGNDIGFIIRKGNWEESEPGGDRYIKAGQVVNGVAEIWLVSMDEKVYFEESLADTSPKLLSASINDANRISFKSTNKFTSNSASTVSLYDEENNQVSLASVSCPTNNFSGYLTTSQPLDFTKTYTLYMTELTTVGKEVVIANAFSTPEFESTFTYEGNDLGANYKKQSTTFKVWAPLASQVVLNLYNDGIGGTAYKSVFMTAGAKGIWSFTEQGDLNKKYYTYSVTNYNKTEEAVDPYAAAVGVNGLRGMVVDMSSTNPEGWDTYKRPTFTKDKSNVYEIHVRDFTIGNNSGVSDANKGKYLGLTETGTKNSFDEATCLDHLTELGINTVHILPIFDFRTVDETDLDTPQFNWGYDPQNYNAPEGSYSSDPYHGEVRIKEFKQMVMAFHKKGIKVVMDVVYNHTGETENHLFNKIVPKYYYRLVDGNYSNGSGCGNETASERSMMRKFMVDSVMHWATDYHIDGFRFDLMGLHDIQTMNTISRSLHAINPDILLYGEGWQGGGSPLPDNQAALKKNAMDLENISVFSDNIRDGIKGHVFTDTAKAFVNGGSNFEETIKFGIAGSVYHPQIDIEEVLWNDAKEFWALTPLSTMTYASAHDNLTLWDKLATSNPDDSIAKRKAMNKMAAAIVQTSQGIPFMLSGEDLLRTKPKVGGGFDENSYKSPDSTNAIDWNRKHEYKDVFEYYKGLISFRQTYDDFTLTSANQVRNAINFKQASDGVVGYNLNSKKGNKYIVYFNANDNEKQITLPSGEWGVYVDKDRAGNKSFKTVTNNYTLKPNESLIVAQIIPETEENNDNLKWIIPVSVIGGLALVSTIVSLIVFRKKIFKPKNKKAEKNS